MAAGKGCRNVHREDRKGGVKNRFAGIPETLIVAAGDFDADAVDDLAVGAPNDKPASPDSIGSVDNTPAVVYTVVSWRLSPAIIAQGGPNG